MSAERYIASRTISAPAETIFAVLTDPARHQDTEPGDWVRTSLTEDKITKVGDVFGINMFLEQIGGAYVMHNRVTVLEPDRTIAWEPGQLNDDGELDTGGWFWRYDLEPADNRTDVTLTYDWSGAPQEVRDEIGGLPPFPPEFLDQSLATLERTVTAG